MRVTLNSRFLLLLSLAPAGFAAALPPAPITVGETLPTIIGQNALGNPVELPSAGAGRERIVVFSFHGASTDFRRWMYHLDRAIGPNGPSIFEVITLGSVPPMFRKMTTDIVRGDVLRDQWGRTVFLYQDEQLWKQRLAVKPGRYSYVVILDGAGTVRWIGSGPYSEAKMAELKAALGAVHTAAE